MKKYLLSAALLALICGTASAQGILGRLGERAKQAVENNVGNKIEKGVNDLLDGKKKDKKDKKAGEDQESEEAGVAANETVDFAEIQAKSDFKRGANVNIKGAKAIRMEASRIQPLMEEKEYLPEEFTIEFDVLAQPAEEGSGWDGTLDLIMDGADGKRVFDIRMSPEYHPYYGGEYSGIGWGWGAENPNGNKMEGEPGRQTINRYLKKNEWNHIAISFNKRAFKMYLNYQRIVNIPNMIQPRSWWMDGSSDSDKGIFVTNIVMAKGAVDLYERNATDYSSAVEKAIAETVTNNILFETGKATLKPESMEEIEKVADYMKKNPNARFEVQGHTDNQGSDKVNDPLSQQRAEAVVKALEEKGVDPFNLRAVGKGAHEPVADNKTEEGRAKNRRVEFIKK